MKTLKFIGKIIVAAIAGFAIMCVAIAFDASDRVAILSYFAVSAIVAVLLGVFDYQERIASRYDSIRHKTGRNYGQAAVFIGTACLFIGTPQECDEVADDLWHHAQQAEVRALTGDETFDIL